MLALSFLLLIGVALVGEGLHFEIPKGYLYFAMAFAFGVELINVRLRRRLDARPSIGATQSSTDEKHADGDRGGTAGQGRPPSAN